MTDLYIRGTGQTISILPDGLPECPELGAVPQFKFLRGPCRVLSDGNIRLARETTELDLGPRGILNVMWDYNGTWREICRSVST